MNKNNYYIVVIFFISLKLQAMEELAVMMGAQTGASIANQSLNQTFHDISQTISSSQQSVQNSMSDFSNSLKASQQKEMTYVNKLFSQAASHVADQKTNQGPLFKQMEQYLYKTVSNQKPKEYFLLKQAAKLDELFTLGSMYTPEGAIWKNIFSVGNWEYDHITKSFWQMQSVPLSQTTKGNSPEKQYLQYANTIFTEYISKESSYEIACSITIHQAQSSFFVGIMFNKNRWISGNMDSITKCRLLGIYKSSSDAYSLEFAEQYQNQNETILYPLQQIIDKESSFSKKLSPDFFQQLTQEPTTFFIRISTSPSKILFKVWKKGTSEPKTFTSITSKNNDLYLYHDIGFISPGAVAEFKLFQPTSLVFSESAHKEFAQDVSQLSLQSTQ